MVFDPPRRRGRVIKLGPLRMTERILEEVESPESSVTILEGILSER